MSARKPTQKRLTKRERKALNPKVARHAHEHIHCVACGVHLDHEQFSDTPASARWLTCDHGSRFACCDGCVAEAKRLLAEHDQSGRPVAAAPAFH